MQRREEKRELDDAGPSASPGQLRFSKGGRRMDALAQKLVVDY